MAEYTKITKLQLKTVKHLLHCATTDTARPILMCIHVNVEDDYLCSADGFVGTFVQYKGSGLENIFPTTGTFQVQLGRLGKDNIIEVVPYTWDGQTFPNLTAITHPKNLEPAITFAVNAHLLSNLIALADGTLVIRVWDNKQTIEMNYDIAGVPTYSLIMPMHVAGERVTRWHPKEYVPPGKLV